MKKIDINFLKRIPLFTDLADDKLELIRKIISERTVDAGTVIIKEGSKGRNMFILLDGEVEVSKTLLLKVAGHGMDQRDKSLIRFTGDDYAFFGEMALFDGNAERSASVIATSKCAIAEIAQEDFFKLTESDHEIGYHVLKNLVTIISNRLDKTTKDVLKLTTALSLALER
ncbi:MAG TPA: cyclic nucleotide-binding domain-containing protein [Bacteroidota bacterium]|nr:cyclic nucleotide-binding domain-containing protein [Bacteroidota bacterium]